MKWGRTVLLPIPLRLMTLGLVRVDPFPQVVVPTIVLSQLIPAHMLVALPALFISAVFNMIVTVQSQPLVPNLPKLYLNMPRFNPYSAPSRGDKQAQATALDLQQQQLDQSGQENMLHQIMQIYGLHQQQQIAPEQLHALQSENTARDQTNSQNAQMFPGQLQAQSLNNQHAQTAQDWSPYNLDLQSREHEQGLAQGAQSFPGQLKAQDLSNQHAQTSQDWMPYNLGLQSRQGEQTLDQQGQLFPGQKEMQGLNNVHMGLENTAQGQSNDWAPWLNQARYDATKSMADEHSAKTGLSMKDAITLRQMGVINDEDLMSSLPPQMQATHAQRQQDQRNSNWPKVVSDAAANGITGHEDNIMQNYGPENLSYLQNLHKRSFVPTSVEPHDPTGVNNWLLNLLPAKRQKPKL